METTYTTLSDADLEKWRYVQDEYADQVALEIMKSPHRNQVHRALLKITTNSQPIDIRIFKDTQESETDEEHNRLVALLDAYFNNTSLLNFSEAQKKIIQKSCEFFDDNAVEAVTVLAVRSLLKQYAAFKATNVLVFTKLLVEYPHRRVLETMQFVLDVMDPKGYEPDGYAIRSIQKLRLVHAIIRARIKLNPTAEIAAPGQMKKNVSWDSDWGLPINQQDMIFALHTFSVEVVDGLRASGEKITSDEIETYYTGWHYIGKGLGIKDAINPMTYKEGKALQKRIYKQQFISNNPNGPALALPLINFMHQVFPLHPSNEHLYAIVKLYNDPADYQVFEKILGLPISKVHHDFLGIVKFLDSIMHHVILFKYLTTPNKYKTVFNQALAVKNYNLLRALVAVQENWGGRGYRMCDAFGESEAIVFEQKEVKRPSLLYRLAHTYIDGLDKNHPSIVVQLLHRLFFGTDRKTVVAHKKVSV